MDRYSLARLLLALSALSMWAADTPIRTLQLEKFGYQRLPCKVDWRGEDMWPKRQIEFLDDEHLLLHYAAIEACQAPLFQGPVSLPGDTKHGLHSAVIDLTGHILHTYDWQPNDDVVAGPDGHVLIVDRDAVRVTDLSFRNLKTIQSHHKPGTHGQLYPVQVTPSRHGFAIIERNRAVLYTGSAYQETARTTEYVAAVSDHGFITVSGFDQGPPFLRVDEVRWPTPSDPSLTTFSDIGRGEILGLDRKFNLYRVDQRGHETLIVRLGSLAPGMWHTAFQLDVALPEAGRILLRSYGVRIALSDSFGFWSYLRTAVLDLPTGKLVFQRDCRFYDDVSLSPNGRLLAVREKDRLKLYSVP